MKATYAHEAHDYQVRCGQNDDPRGALMLGQTYEVDRVESLGGWVHRYWIDGRKYNSVHFERDPNWNSERNANG